MILRKEKAIWKIDEITIKIKMVRIINVDFCKIVIHLIQIIVSVLFFIFNGGGKCYFLNRRSVSSWIDYA